MSEEQAQVSEETTEQQDFVVAEEGISRPEWLPEKFKTEQDLLKSYESLESKLGQKETDLRETWEKEIHEAAFADRPASSGDYQLPENIDETLAPDNDLLNWWSTFAWENGLSQDEFSQGIAQFEKTTANSESAREDEIGKLGDNAQERLQAAGLFANQFFPQDTLPAIERMAETADGIKALEHIMEQLKTSTSIQTEPANRIDQASLEAMMKDERWWNPSKRDQAYIQQVNEGFNKLYNGS